MSAPAAETPGVRRAWGWVGHLRAGGTTPWSAWHGDAEGTSRFLPGAQQLELVRRLNLAGGEGGSARGPSAALTERVLAASAPGRGRPDLELAGAFAPRRFGPPPVDPGDLPDEELLRVASGLLAEDVVAQGLPAPGRAALPRPWRTPYRLVGDPWLADPLRARLIQRGRPPGGRAPTVVVLATDLPTMLAHAWTSRSFDVGGPSWRGWLGVWAQRAVVPPRADVLHMARHWAAEVGPDRVQVVLAPAALPALGRLVGVRTWRREVPAGRRVAAEGAELARHVAAVLGLLVDPPLRAQLLERTLLPRLDGRPGSRLTIPPEHRGWVGRRATRMRDALLADGYRVHGDLGTLTPEPTGPGVRGAGPEDDSEPAADAVLDLAVRLLLEEPSAATEEARI